MLPKNLDPAKIAELYPFMTDKERAEIDRLLFTTDVFRKTYEYDPVAFVHDCFIFPEGRSITHYQEHVLSEIIEKKRISARGPHGLGKTAMSAWLILWFALTRDGDDWLIPTTASAWRQLEFYLWPEVHKWSRRLRWERIARGSFNDRTELLSTRLVLKTGFSFAQASDEPGKIEGAHADRMLYILDESKHIMDRTFDAVEGAFSNAGTDTANEAYAFAVSTPGLPIGRFYDIHMRKPGLQEWEPIHVTLEDVVSAGVVSAQWAENKRQLWGENSSVYINKVLGNFASADSDGVIPLEWVDLAVERWKDWDTQDRPGTFVAVGVDVATGGKDTEDDVPDAVDQTTLALRYQNLLPNGQVQEIIGELRRTAKEDTMETTGRVVGLLNRFPLGRAVVDVIGVGAGVVHRLREMNHNVLPFNSNEKTERRDSSGELGFPNKRSAQWWYLREILDPKSGKNVALPPDDLLLGDLLAPKWIPTSDGKIKVESKDDIRRRLKRSTDSADAVVYALYDPPPKRRSMVSSVPTVGSSRWLPRTRKL